MNKAGIEIERKYIIEQPSAAELERMAEHTVSRIEQIYLDSPMGETLRVRRREWQGRIEYIETKKIRIDKMSSTEIERELSCEEYSVLAERRAEGTYPIYKTRHTFIYCGQLFEIDLYPEWSRTAIMETELNSRDTEVEFPPFIRIIREVTGEREYSNAAMSRHFPGEDTVHRLS